LQQIPVWCAALQLGAEEEAAVTCLWGTGQVWGEQPKNQPLRLAATAHRSI